MINFNNNGYYSLKLLLNLIKIFDVSQRKKTSEQTLSKSTDPQKLEVKTGIIKFRYL